MKDSIINLINALAARTRPCIHEWELLSTRTCGTTLNVNYTWNEYHYRCVKCCEHKKISTE